MKKVITIIVIFFISSIQWTMANDNEIQIVYKVNENIVSNIDVNNEAQYLKALNKNFQNMELNKLKEYAAQSLVKELIKKDEIEKFYEVDYASSEVDKYVEALGSRLGFTNISNFKDYLSKNSIEYSEVRKKFVIEKTWNSLIYQIYNKQVVINEKEISSKLEKIVNQNTFQETFRLSEIIFPASNKSDFEKKYKKILQDIEVMGFDQAAIIHSISDTSNFGGEVGWVKESQLSKKIYDLIKDLKINQLTKPITTPGGVLILKVNEIKNTPNDEVDKEVELSKIIKAEKNRQLNEYSVIHFRKIENRSYVKKI